MPKGIKLFDNGAFQVYQDLDSEEFWFWFGEEYTFDLGSLLEFCRFLVRKDASLGLTTPFSDISSLRQ